MTSALAPLGGGLLILNTMEKVHGGIQVAAAAWTSLNSTPPNNNHEELMFHGLLSKGHGDYVLHLVGEPLPKQGPHFVFPQWQIYSYSEA